MSKSVFRIITGVRVARIAGAVGAGIGAAALYVRGTTFEKTIIVKDCINQSIGPSEACVKVKLVTDINDNTYKCSPSLFYLHFYNDSNKIWSQMEANKTYKVTGYGYTYPSIGLYPNLVSSELVIYPQKQI